jgi:hypothetical protein
MQYDSPHPTVCYFFLTWEDGQFLDTGTIATTGPPNGHHMIHTRCWAAAFIFQAVKVARFFFHVVGGDAHRAASLATSTRAFVKVSTGLVELRAKYCVIVRETPILCYVGGVVTTFQEFAVVKVEGLGIFIQASLSCPKKKGNRRADEEQSWRRRRVAKHVVS